MRLRTQSARRREARDRANDNADRRIITLTFIEAATSHLVTRNSLTNLHAVLFLFCSVIFEKLSLYSGDSSTMLTISNEVTIKLRSSDYYGGLCD